MNRFVRHVQRVEENDALGLDGSLTQHLEQLQIRRLVAVGGLEDVGVAYQLAATVTESTVSMSFVLNSGRKRHILNALRSSIGVECRCGV